MQRRTHAATMPVANVAFESGFGSLSRFYEAFTQRFGHRPGAFRRHLAKASRQIRPAAETGSRREEFARTAAGLLKLQQPQPWDHPPLAKAAADGTQKAMP